MVCSCHVLRSEWIISWALAKAPKSHSLHAERGGCLLQRVEFLFNDRNLLRLGGFQPGLESLHTRSDSNSYQQLVSISRQAAVCKGLGNSPDTQSRLTRQHITSTNDMYSRARTDREASKILRRRFSSSITPSICFSTRLTSSSAARTRRHVACTQQNGKRQSRAVTGQ